MKHTPADTYVCVCLCVHMRVTCVRARACMPMCVHALHVCARVLHVSVCYMCACLCVCLCVRVLHVHAHVTCVCVRVCYMCVCVCARVRCSCLICLKCVPNAPSASWAHSSQRLVVSAKTTNVRTALG